MQVTFLIAKSTLMTFTRNTNPKEPNGKSWKAALLLTET